MIRFPSISFLKDIQLDLPIISNDNPVLMEILRCNSIILPAFALLTKGYVVTNIDFYLMLLQIPGSYLS